MTQKRTFTLNLKNDQQIVLEFAPIAATGDRLWQMFATTEALDTVDHIIGIVPPETKSVVKTKPIKQDPPKVVTKKTTAKKK
jgi:hypothetical protein